MAKSMKIVNGPSKFDLSVALFHKPTEGGHYHPVTFEFGGEGKSACHLMSVGIEDGSRESWLITVTLPNGQYASGYYTTKRRTGILST